jgi:hypothetical protein
MRAGEEEEEGRLACGRRATVRESVVGWESWSVNSIGFVKLMQVESEYGPVVIGSEKEAQWQCRKE